MALISITLPQLRGVAQLGSTEPVRHRKRWETRQRLLGLYPILLQHGYQEKIVQLIGHPDGSRTPQSSCQALATQLRSMIPSLVINPSGGRIVRPGTQHRTAQHSTCTCTCTSPSFPPCYLKSCRFHTYIIYMYTACLSCFALTARQQNPNEIINTLL